MLTSATEHLGPCRKIRLRPFFLNDETRDRGPENATPAHVEAASEARVEPGSVCVPGTRHVDDPARRDPRDPNSAFPGGDRAPPRSQRRHHDRRGSKQSLRCCYAGEPLRADALRLIPQEILRSAPERA